MSLRDRIRRHGPTRTGFRNWRNRRTLNRGRMPRWERPAAEARSRIPFYRNRINPATGRQRRDDGWLHRRGNESLKRMKDTHQRRTLPVQRENTGSRDSRQREIADRARHAQRQARTRGGTR